MKRVMLRRIAVAGLMVLLTVTMIPGAAFAEDGAAEQNPSGTPEAQVPVEEQVSVQDVPAGEKLADSEELLYGYIDKMVRVEKSPTLAGSQATGKTTRGSRLTGRDKLVYDNVVPEIKKIAAGERSSSVISIPYAALGLTDTKLTFKELNKEFGLQDLVPMTDENGDPLTDEDGTPYKGFSSRVEKALADYINIDADAVLNALLADYPYEMYWFSKVDGEGMLSQLMGEIRYLEDTEANDVSLNFAPNGTESDGIELYFCVAKDYAKDWLDDENANNLTLDTTKTSAAANTAATVAGIIEENANKGDIEKLEAYRDEIHDLTAYEDSVVLDNQGKGVYGDIWQLIYVFDRNPDTNVVCEGYSKAFQYLCDQTTFADKDIQVNSVTGYMSSMNNGVEKQEPHMWNIVDIDGKNYLADITNTDESTIGNPDCRLFLAGTSSEGTVNMQVTDDFGTKNYESPLYAFSWTGANAGSAEYYYEIETLDTFTEAELALETKSYYESTGTDPTDPNPGGGDDPDNPNPGGGDDPDNPNPGGGDNPTDPNPGTGTDPVNPNPGTGTDPVNPNPGTGTDPVNPNPGTGTDPVNPNPGSGGSTYKDVDSVTPSDATADNAATNNSLKIAASKIATTANTSKKQMTITWKKVTGATNYRLQYKKAGAKKWTTVWTKGKNSYVLKKLANNGMYEFRIAAFSKSGSTWTKSPWSAVNYRFFAGTTGKAKTGKKSFTVKAKKYAKGTGYQVLYSTKKNMAGAKVKTFNGAKKVNLKIKGLKKGKKYYYQIRPIKKYKGKTYVGILSGAKAVKVK